MNFCLNALIMILRIHTSKRKNIKECVSYCKELKNENGISSRVEDISFGNISKTVGFVNDLEESCFSRNNSTNMTDMADVSSQFPFLETFKSPNYSSNFEEEDFNDFINTSKLVELDPDEIDDFFKNCMNLSKESYRNEKLNEQLDITKIDSDIENVEIKIKSDFSFEITIGNNNQINFMDVLKNDIEKFIESNIVFFYHDYYRNRLEKIKQTYEINSRHKIDFNKFLNIFRPPIDKEIIEKLKRMHFEFDKCTIFDQDTCLKFTNVFDLQIYNSDMAFKTRRELCLLSNEQKNLFFNFEFMNLYKHVHELPQILTLGGSYIKIITGDLIFVLHTINVFIENIKNLRENEVFITCLLAKAFSCSFRKNLDLFVISKHNIFSVEYHRDLYFFSWEIDITKRKAIKQRPKNNYNSLSKYNDEVHLKIILLIFLYQHMLFMNHHGMNDEDMRLFIDFFNKVKNENKCTSCQFENFLELAKHQINNLK